MALIDMLATGGTPPRVTAPGLTAVAPARVPLDPGGVVRPAPGLPPLTLDGGPAVTLDTGGLVRPAPARVAPRTSYAAVPPPVTPQATTPPPPTQSATSAPTLGSFANTLEGFDWGKLQNPAHTTIKYQAGRVFSQFSPQDYRRNPDAVLAALQSAGVRPTPIPDAAGGDHKIDFGDGYGPIDVVRGGGGWQWAPAGAATGTSGAGTGTDPGTGVVPGGTGGSGGGYDPYAGVPPSGGGDFPSVPGVPLPGVPDVFDDEATNFLEELIRFRIEELFQSVSDPQRDQFGNLLQGRVNELTSNQGNPALDQFLAALTSRQGALNTPLATPQLSELFSQGEGRIDELLGDVYTPNERAILQTEALEPIESLRQASKTRALERASSRGFGPSSGLTEIDMRDIDRASD